MTNEEKEKAMEIEQTEFNLRFENLVGEATKLATMEGFYFKPTAEMQRKTLLLNILLSNENMQQQSVVIPHTPPFPPQIIPPAQFEDIS